MYLFSIHCSLFDRDYITNYSLLMTWFRLLTLIFPFPYLFFQLHVLITLHYRWVNPIAGWKEKTKISSFSPVPAWAAQLTEEFGYINHSGVSFLFNWDSSRSTTLSSLLVNQRLLLRFLLNQYNYKVYTRKKPFKATLGAYAICMLDPNANKKKILLLFYTAAGTCYDEVVIST